MIEPALSDERFLADVESADESRLHLWWLGQSGFLMKWKRLRVLVDPYLSDSLTKKYATTDKPHVRMTRRVVDPTELRNIDFVTASHAHTDHLDAETLQAVRKSNPAARLIAPRAIREIAIERWGDESSIIWPNDGESVNLPLPVGRGRGGEGEELGITAVPAAHETIERDAAGDCKFLGYVFRLGPHVVYHSGDTMLYDGMVERLRPFNIDVALLPINGRAVERRVAGNLNGIEAAGLAHAIGAKRVVPCHYEMFEFNTASPQDFVRECEQIGKPHVVLRAGERLTV